MSTMREVYYGKMRLSIRKWMNQKQLNDWLADRAKLKATIDRLAENGIIVVSESGMDCDCVAYSGRNHVVPANVPAVVRAVNLIYQHAEGPVSHGLYRPSEADGIEYESRDLGSEAFENGHAHVVYR